MQPEKNEVTKVYYDGGCQVCSLEVNHYQKKNDGKVDFIDINDEQFCAADHGLDEKDVHVNLHAKLADGKIIKGVDTFIVIWQNIPGFAFLAKLIKVPFFYFLAKQGYKVFVRIRPYLPRKKTK